VRTPLFCFFLSDRYLILYRRRLDLKNERLPDFNPDIARKMFSAPSMRRLADSDLELLIRKTLREEGEEDGMAKQIAEKITKTMRTPEAAQDKERKNRQTRQKAEGRGRLRRPSTGNADKQMIKVC
jgi:hypothetical protein